MPIASVHATATFPPQQYAYTTDFPEMMLNGVQMDEQFFFSSYISILMFIRKNITSILCRVCSIQDYVLKRVKNKGKNNK